MYDERNRRNTKYARRSDCAGSPAPRPRYERKRKETKERAAAIALVRGALHSCDCAGSRAPLLHLRLMRSRHPAAGIGKRGSDAAGGLDGWRIILGMRTSVVTRVRGRHSGRPRDSAGSCRLAHMDQRPALDCAPDAEGLRTFGYARPVRCDSPTSLPVIAL
eukprot:scaffold21359_cov112-Isochrysis_galbana.AAC.2